MKRTRLNIFLEPEHAKLLQELAVMKDLSKSSLVAAALASFLSPDNADRREAAIAKRLDRLTQQLHKLERDQNILIETVALYVRYYFSVSPALPEAHQEAARGQGRVRFDQFVQQLGRHLQRGHSLVREVYDEMFPDESQFFGPSDDSMPGAAESTL
jgi:hypothetical protein